MMAGWTFSAEQYQCQMNILQSRNTITSQAGWQAGGEKLWWGMAEVQCIHRGHVYRGLMLDPIFFARIYQIFADMLPGSMIFLACAVTPWTQFTGDNFSRNLLTTIAFVPVQLFQEINSSLSVSVSWNTCCVMGSHARQSTDTSIVSQSSV